MATATDPMFLIIDPEWETPTELCSGPDSTGGCPGATEGRPVACAGRQLVLLQSDLSPRWTRIVGAVEEECPLSILCAGGG